MRRMPLARRIVTIALAVVAAGLFAVAVQGGRWWDVGPDVHVGLSATERCFGDDCAYSTLAWTGGSSTWERLGVATYVGALVSALALVALGGAVAARRTGRLAAAVVTVATLTSTAVAIGFFVMAPDLPGATLGRGPYLFAGAVLATIGAVVSVATAKR